MGTDSVTATPTGSVFHVEFDGLDTIKGTGDAHVRFRISRDADSEVYPDQYLSFEIVACDDGVGGLIRRGYDELVAALQQMLWEADTQRRAYKRETV
jgi:hypothetical protein